MASASERKGNAAHPIAEPVLTDVVVARLTALEAGQNAMNGALGLMLDTLQAQTNLLRKLNEYASEEPAASPVAKVLSELTSAITDLDASIGSMETNFGKLSDTIAAAYEIELEGRTPGTINGKDS